MIEETKNNEETIDIKRLILKYLSYWFYFILSILFCLFIAFLINRYTIPTYSISTTLLIRDDNNTSMGAENLLEGLELFSGSRNLKNEIVILQSYSLSDRVVRKMNLGITYFQHGYLLTNELYKSAPFSVYLDSTRNQLTGVDFNITIINADQYELSVKTKDSYAYNCNTNKSKKSEGLANINFKQDFNFNDTIKHNFFSFVIKKTDFFKYNAENPKKYNYSFKLHNHAKLVGKYINKVSINPINKETSVLRLNIKGHTPKKHIHFLDQLTTEYIKAGLNEKNIMAFNTINFIDNQLYLIKDSLINIENKLEEFRRSNPNLESVDKEYGSYFQKQKLDNSLSEQSVNIKYYESLLTYLKNEKDPNNIVSPTSMGISNPELNGLIDQLLNLYSKKGDLQLTTTEKNPTYQAVIAQIDHTRNTIIENVKNLISSASIYKQDLIKRINEFNTRISKLPEAEKKYLILKRSHQHYEQTAIYLKNKRYEASLAKAGTESDHKVIDSARLDNEKPISPKGKLSYIIAIIIGFGFPISVISIKDFFSESIKSKQDLKQNTSLPILGVIGHSDRASDLIIPSGSKTIIAESFRSLRTNIQYIASEKKNKIITITSSVGGEGKTFMAINLSTIFAFSGHKTILIGGDLRKPKLHQDFNINPTNGLSNYLINQSSLSEIIQTSGIQSLDIIASGPNPPNPAELLDNPRMKKLLEELQKKYDYIIIDTPPIGLVTDGVILMQYADANLYIVRHNYTKKSSLQAINNLYKQKQIKNAHIIINDYDHKIDGGGYGYGYGYGYQGYGYYEEETNTNEKES